MSPTAAKSPAGPIAGPSTLPATPSRRSSRVRFGSQRKRDPNNIYREGDDLDGPGLFNPGTPALGSRPLRASSQAADVGSHDFEDHMTEDPSSATNSKRKSSPIDFEVIDVDDDDDDIQLPPKKKRLNSKGKEKTTKNPGKSVLKNARQPTTTSDDDILFDVMTEDGFLKDIQVAVGSTPTKRKTPRSMKTEDIRAFFTAEYIGADKKNYRRCKECRKAKKEFELGDYHMSLRRHCEIYHEFNDHNDGPLMDPSQARLRNSDISQECL